MMKDNKNNRKIVKNRAKEKLIKEIIFVIVILYFSLFGYILIQNIINYDTMWTFLFSKKIADGYILYKDYNMLQMPLFAQISALFLRIFGNNILVFEMVGVLYAILIGVFSYLILRKLKIPIKSRVLIMLIEYIFMCKIICNSYNILALFFLLTVVYIELCKIRYEKYFMLKKRQVKKSTIFIYNMITGVLLGLTFLSKQNIGFYLVLGITFTYFLKALYLKEKKFIEVFKELTVKAMFCILTISTEIVYFALNGALYDFINYTFGGIGSFNNNMGSSLIKALLFKGTFIEILINGLILICLIIIPLYIFGERKNLIKEKHTMNSTLYILLFFILLLGLGYSIPLPNEYHINITRFIGIFIFCIIIFSVNKIRVFINKTLSKTIFNLMIIIPVIIGLINIFIYYRYTYKSEIEVFKGAFLPKQTQNQLVSTYIHILLLEKQNNKPLYVITSDSAIYSLILNRNQGVFDLPLRGNLGHKDYIELINKLEKLKQTEGEHYVMIFTKDEDVFWQESQDFRKYVKDNYLFVEEYLNYSIYEYIINE